VSWDRLPHTSDLLPHTSDLLPHTSDLLPLASYLLLHASCLLWCRKTSCLLPLASYKKTNDFYLCGIPGIQRFQHPTAPCGITAFFLKCIVPPVIPHASYLLALVVSQDLLPLASCRVVRRVGFCRLLPRVVSLPHISCLLVCREVHASRQEEEGAVLLAASCEYACSFWRDGRRRKETEGGGVLLLLQKGGGGKRWKEEEGEVLARLPVLRLLLLDPPSSSFRLAKEQENLQNVTRQSCEQFWAVVRVFSSPRGLRVVSSPPSPRGVPAVLLPLMLAPLMFMISHVESTSVETSPVGTCSVAPILFALQVWRRGQAPCG